jgi:hypothetical protein
MNALCVIASALQYILRILTSLCLGAYASDPETRTRASCSNIWTRVTKPSSSRGKDSEGVYKHSQLVDRGTSHIPSSSSRALFNGTAYKKKVINIRDVVYKGLTIFFLSQVKNKSHHG